MTGPPPGWYDEPDSPGRERWWDGEQWTEHRRSGGPEASGMSLATSATPEGWYPEPGMRGSMRWWDGQQWTAERRKASADELAQVPAHREIDVVDIRARGAVRTGFGLAAGWALFFFVFVPLLFIVGCGALISTGHHSLIILPPW